MLLSFQLYTLEPDELPSWFQYPTVFLNVINQGLTDFHPWHMLGKDDTRWWLNGLRARFPDWEIVPFARRTDSDIVAGFEKNDNTIVVVFEDFQPAKRVLHRYSSFQDWVRAAIEDLLSFAPEGPVWTPPKPKVR